MTKRSRTSRALAISAIALIIVVAAGAFLFLRRAAHKTPAEAPEIAAIKASSSIEEQAKHLRDLLKRVGPSEAQDDMNASGLPYTGQTHLLVHNVGEYIYENYGLSGLSMCKEYFLAACYHGFLIDAIADHGVDGIAPAIEDCEKQGGLPVEGQCAHAAGHGFTAWYDYDLPEALASCDELGEKVASSSAMGAGFPYFNCYDGVFMENVWGVHDDTGTFSEKRWVKDSDIYYPCDDPRIPEKYVSACYAEQATLMYMHFNGDIPKVASSCDAIQNKDYRDMCFNSLYREIHPMTQGSLEKVFSLCSLTGAENRDECVMTDMTAYWSVGDKELPFKICDALSGGTRSECLFRLSQTIELYYPNINDRKPYCEKILDKTIRAQCER